MILGIDYGTKKVGLALADKESRLAEPYKTQRYDDAEVLIERLKKIANEKGVKEVVIGISEGLTAQKTKEFGEKIQKELRMPVAYYNETLSTNEAKYNSINAGIKRIKRQKLEDAYAAAIMLQDYLDFYKS